MIINSCGETLSQLPEFTYTGTYTLTHDIGDESQWV